MYATHREITGKNTSLIICSPFWRHHVDNEKRLGAKLEFISTDEMMLMNYRRAGETLRMRHNPIKSGFKLWALCDFGYIFSALPYSNGNPWKHYIADKGKLPYPYAVRKVSLKTSLGTFQNAAVLCSTKSTWINFSPLQSFSGFFAKEISEQLALSDQIHQAFQRALQ